MDVSRRLEGGREDVGVSSVIDDASSPDGAEEALTEWTEGARGFVEDADDVCFEVASGRDVDGDGTSGVAGGPNENGGRGFGAGIGGGGGG